MSKSYYLVWNKEDRKVESASESIEEAEELSESGYEIYEIPPDEIELAIMKHFNDIKYSGLSSFFEGTGFKKVDNV